MEKKPYRLQILPLFEDDLNPIVDYISDTLHNPEAALEFVDAVEKAIAVPLPCAESF